MGWIPVVPNTTHNTVINKTIVYSDTILSFNEKGENLKVTSIDNVEDYELESCLKTIFESNSNITFNTIQYSRNRKRLYFYADKNVDINSWEKVKFTKYKYVDSEEVIEIIDRILNQSVSKDENVVSLYMVSKLLEKIRNEQADVKNDLDKKLESKLQERFKKSSFYTSYYDNELTLNFQEYYSFENPYKKLVFKRKNGELYLIKSNYHKAIEILGLTHDILDKMFDLYESKQRYFCMVSPVNVDLRVILYENFVSLKTRDDNPILIMKKYSDYEVECNSNKVLSYIEGKEEKIFKNVFMNIKDCPKFIREDLTMLRKKEIEYILKQQEKEIKRQQRKEKIEKIIPFSKKR